MKMGKQGYTLIELMIALAVTGIVTAAVYTTYKSQQDSYIAQEQVAVMQQNLRAVMFYLEREVRLAGCNPSEIADSAFTAATPTSLSFTMDITGGQSDGYDNDHNGQVDEAAESSFTDGDVDDPGETITYTFANSTVSRNDGVADSPIAGNIDALNFVYLNANIGDGVDNDGDGVIDNLAEGRIRAAGDATPLTAAELRTIRAVHIALLVRSDRGEPKIWNDEVYRNQVGDILFGQDTDGDGRRDGGVGVTGPPDNLRRRLLTTTIKCRNFGM